MLGYCCGPLFVPVVLVTDNITGCVMGVEEMNLCYEDLQDQKSSTYLLCLQRISKYHRIKPRAP